VVVAATLLCALLAFVARFMRLARENQDRTELLLAQLEDAREEQTRAAAVAERGRIAGELHDVLAHSLSGAAIQLQGTRMLAERDGAGPEMRSAIERASELVRDGLSSARQAVGALRGDPMPGVTQLPALVDSYRDDLHLDVTLCVEGQPRALSADASLALYRAAQEALTNVARYARGAQTSVVLRYGDERTSVIVENGPPPDDERGGVADLRGVGGGRGLAGLRERLERVDGVLVAGAADGGWRVVADIRA
jgi:signal transduction histidine kinase